MSITAADIKVRFSSEGADAVAKDTDSLGSKIDNIGSKARSLGTGLTAGLTLPLVGGFTAAFMGAASLEQAFGKTEAVFGDLTQGVLDWSQNSAQAFGMSRSEALSMVSTYGAIFQAMGVGREQAADYSQEMIGLAADMAAFNDVSTDRTAGALRAALTGEYEALKQYGIVLRAADVDQRALADSGKTHVDQLTEAERVQARYNIIMEQTAQQQGQFAEESDGASGSLAIFRAELKDAAANIGRVLLPAGTKLIRMFTDWLRGLDNLSDTQRRWVVGIGLAAAAIGPLLIAVGTLFPLLATGAGIFAALLSPIGLLAAAFIALAVIFKDDIMDAAQAVGDLFVELRESFTKFREMGVSPVQSALMALADVFPALGQVIAPLRGLVENLGDAFNALRQGDYAGMFDALGAAARSLGSTILGAVRSISWEAIGSALWGVITAAGEWVGQQVLNIPAIAVSIVEWGISALENIWDKITSWVMGGTYGDGTGGATAGKVGGITLPQVGAMILGWAIETIQDVGAAIRDHIGSVVVTLLDVTIQIVDWSYKFPGSSNDPVFKIEKDIQAMLAAGIVLATLVPVSVPIALTLGAIAGLIIMRDDIFKAVEQWMLDNPTETIKINVRIAILWQKVMQPGGWLEQVPIIGDTLKVIRRLEEDIQKIKALKATLEGLLRWVFNMGDTPLTDAQEDAQYGGRGGGGTNVGTAPAGGGSAGGGPKQFGNFAGFEAGAALARSAIDNLVSAAQRAGAAVGSFASSASAHLGSVGKAAQAGLTPIPPLVTQVAGALLGQGIAAFTQVNAAAQSNLNAMRGTAQAVFATIAAVAIAQVSAMAGNVQSRVAAMRGAVAASLSGMQSQGTASMNAMASAAASAGSRMASSLGAGAQQAAGAVRSALSAIPGIVASIGGSAASTAYSIGANIGNSFAAGMRAALGAIQAAAAQMVAAADTALRARAQIASPSRVFMQLGEYVGEGFEQGIRHTYRDVARATNGLVGIPSGGTPGYGLAPAYAGGRSIHIGQINITQQPGQDGRALYREFVTAMEQDLDRVGGVR